jgi:hypothetical protein
MNPMLQDIIHESESRYLTKDEMQKVVAFTTSLPARFKAASAVEQKEEAIVRGVVEQIKRRYPNFERYHPSAWEKSFRDIQLSLRYTVQAMVWDDPNSQADRLLHWLATIFMSFGFTPQFNRDTYTFLREAVRQNVPAEAFSLLESFLETNIEILGSIPEPAQALV